MKDKINQIIAEYCQVNLNIIKPNSTFTVTLGIDSLDVLEIVMEIENEFNIEIPDIEAEKVIIIQDLYDLVATIIQNNIN